MSGIQPIFFHDCCCSKFRSISVCSSGVSSASWGAGDTVATAAASGASGGRGKKVGFPGGTVPVYRVLVRVTVKGSEMWFFESGKIQ